MIESVRLTNVSTGQTELLTSDEGNYIIDSIDWGMPSVSFNQYRVPFQIGETLDSTVIGTRNINIVGYVVSTMESQAETWSDYFEELERDVESKKLSLDKLINVNHDILLSVGDYNIKGRPTQYPKYSTSEGENNEVLCLFSIELLCYAPMFTKGDKSLTMLGTNKLFHFPLIIPETKGVMFGIRTRTQALIINNEGDVETGMVLDIVAVNGEVKNPMIYNIQTGEIIGFQGLTLDKGDRLTVNTNIGEEAAIWYDSNKRKSTSVIGLLSVKSTLIRLKQGVTFLIYDLENETLSNAEITVTFAEQYANIRGM